MRGSEFDFQHFGLALLVQGLGVGMYGDSAKACTPPAKPNKNELQEKDPRNEDYCPFNPGLHSCLRIWVVEIMAPFECPKY